MEMEIEIEKKREREGENKRASERDGLRMASLPKEPPLIRQ